MPDTRAQLNRFLVDVFHSVLRKEEQLLRQAGYGDLSVSEVHVIEACVQAGQSGQNTSRSVAGRLGITPGSLTAAVNVLEKKGYLKRGRDPSDRRRVLLSPTAAALGAFDAHRAIHERMIDEVMGQLSGEESRLLTRALQGVARFFDEERTRDI